MSWLPDSSKKMVQSVSVEKEPFVPEVRSINLSKACAQPKVVSSDTSSPSSYSEVIPENVFNPPRFTSMPAGDSHTAVDSESTDFPLIVKPTSCHNVSGAPASPQSKQKKKVGRPIAYKGDPSAPNLTEVERRRIKRRIANRESARRVRARRQETLEELQIKMDNINVHNAHMVRHIAEVEGHSALLKGQLQECEAQWNKAIAKNSRLHQQVSLLNSKADEQAKNTGRSWHSHENNAANMSVGDASLADMYCAAPITGISSELIEELPTMALPFSEGLLLPESYDEECPFTL